MKGAVNDSFILTGTFPVPKGVMLSTSTRVPYQIADYDGTNSGVRENETYIVYDPNADAIYVDTELPGHWKAMTS